MARQKLNKFAYSAENEKVIESGKQLYDSIKGNWNKLLFKNDNKIVLELGCGKGEYSIGLSEIFPERNFIGVDIKGDRIAVGAKRATDNNIKNVAFLRTQILELENFFEKGEVSEIWVTFPDPRMRDRDERRRLISPRFLELYKKVLLDGGVVNLKTDDEPLFTYSDELVRSMGLKLRASTNDLYRSNYLEMCYGIQTTYEKKFLAKGKKINFLSFELL